MGALAGARVAALVLLAVASAARAQDGAAPARLFPSLTISAPNSPSRACARQSRQLDRALANRTLWAMHMLDASALGSSGALAGSVFQLGDYDQCLSAGAPWPAQYCLAGVHYDVPHTGALPLHHQEYAANGSVWDKVHYNGAENHMRLDTVTWGLCVPSGCDAEDVQGALEAHLAAARDSLARASNVSVAHCTAPLRRIYEADALDALFGVLVGVLVSLVAVGTLLDLQDPDVPKFGKEQAAPLGLGRRMLLCFSARRSLRALLAPEPRPGGLNTEPVSGVRFLNMLLLVCAHRVLNVFRGPVHNHLAVATRAVEDLSLTGVIHGQLFVDTCFYLAGLLLALYELYRPQPQGFGRSLLLRYIRLTPTYAIIILFYASAFYKTGSGPLWDMMIGVERESCRNYWWTNLLYINNYVPTDTLCVFQSWSLAADMHYFIFGMLLLSLVRRRYRWGVAALAALFAVSVAVPLALTALQRWPAMLMFTPSFLRDIHRSPMFRLVYSASHNRASPYLMGIGAALVLHKLQQRQFRFSARWTWTMEVVAASAMMPVLFTSVVFYNPEHKYDALEAGVYAATAPIAWTIGLVAGTLSSLLGTKSIVRLTTTPRPFLVLSKLTYCVYLVHWIYQMSFTATLRAPYHQEDFKMMQESAGDILNSFVLAFVLHLAVEAPTRTLAKLLLSPQKGGSQRYAMTRSSEQRPSVGPGSAPQHVPRVSADPNGNVVKTEN
ncbi:nose resistant to fluoxetine protein 6-like isoform X2 [Frankliniella occidentalis]|uniref:Nose resistant to fluoxetine protein 6-like isoform X2 n=1 Tax=Frankliniella occidentalis TaxID=133901 RepID=A0A6J1TKP0_FRAOC|nr:nose resistant to fluoxetine protein 6-like isoform X2 [Frankliniella occidentalis]